MLQPMARLTSMEQHSDKEPPTVVTQATTWWETVLTLVKVVEIGLGIYLPVVLYEIMTHILLFPHPC